MTAGAVDIEFQYQNTTVRLAEVRSVWYRRGDISYANKASRHELNDPIFKHSVKEWWAIRDFMHFLLYQKRSLGSLFSELRNNKLINLVLANEVGLKTPTTYIFDCKKRIKSVTNKPLITKPIFDHFTHASNDQYMLAGGTSLVDLNELDKIGDLGPSLLQERVTKSYEVRVFHMNGRNYAMAIFSQSTDHTSLDYRVADPLNPLRTVPYELPNILEKQINELMSRLDYDTGSLDFIVDQYSDHYFLEINPSGQFDWVSYNCGYNIEKEIALYLKGDDF